MVECLRAFSSQPARCICVNVPMSPFGGPPNSQLLEHPHVPHPIPRSNIPASSSSPTTLSPSPEQCNSFSAALGFSSGREGGTGGGAAGELREEGAWGIIMIGGPRKYWVTPSNHYVSHLMINLRRHRYSKCHLAANNIAYVSNRGELAAGGPLDPPVCWDERQGSP